MAIEPIKLTLPWPPATNNLYRTLVLKDKIIRVKTGQAKKFANEVGKICQSQRIKPFIGDVAVDVKAYRPRRVGDLDGTFKAAFDALKGHAYNDDKQIAEIHAVRFEDKNNPRVEIEIRPLGLY